MAVTKYLEGVIIVYTTEDLAHMLHKAVHQKTETKVVLRRINPVSDNAMFSITETFNEVVLYHQWPMGIVEYEHLGRDSGGYFSYGFHIRERGVIDL